MIPHSVARYAPTAMVATIDHLATGAAVDLLRRGGSAADAAIAANAVLAVTAPHMCGMGGDLWALVHHRDGAPPAALDAAGMAGSGADAERARADGLERLPLRHDIRAVTVPGAVDGWLALHDRFGRLPLDQVFHAAVGFAQAGFAAAPMLALLAPEVAGVAHSELPAAVVVGQRVTRPGSARALLAIADKGRAGFYGGEFGEGLLAAGPDEFTPDDLGASQARWVEPIGASAFGHRIWSPPPTSQGYLSLLGAAIADCFEIPDDGSGAHLLIEAAVQAAHDRPAVLFDGADPSELLAPALIDARQRAIDPDHASAVDAVDTPGDTTYLCVVDGDGMAVSLINSNASGFGAHIVAGSSGIFVHDRGLGFSLEADHPALYGPGRRPPHTLAPALVTNNTGSLISVLGTMGGDTQPQVVLQLLAASLLHHADPGRAIGNPRWRIAPAEDTGGFDTWRSGGARQLAVEPHFPDAARHELVRRGHELFEAHWSGFGHAQMIAITEHGSLVGAADPRSLSGSASGY